MFKTRTKIEFSELNEANEAAFIAEFNDLNYHKSLQSYKFRASKCDFSREEALIFELLCEIKADLLELKDQRAMSFLPLDELAFSTHVGYEGFMLEGNLLSPSARYYARMQLDTHTVALFFDALGENEVVITRIKRADQELLNHYVADIQRHLIQQKKEEQNAN